MSAVDAFCECDVDDGYMSEFYSVRRVTARKTHKCYECHRQIKPGERYERVASKGGGTSHTVATCPHCLAIIDWIEAHVPCFCRMHGQLSECMEDYVRAGRELDAPGFVFGLLRRVVAVERARKEQ